MSAVLGVFPGLLPFTDLGLDVSRRQRRGPVVRGHRRLEFAAAHGPQQGLIVGQLQGHDGGMEGLP